MQSLSKDDFSNEKFKFATSKFITINNINFGLKDYHMLQPGYELYVDISDAKQIYETIIETGKNLIYLIVECMHLTP